MYIYANKSRKARVALWAFFLSVKFNLLIQIYEVINRIKVMWNVTALLK